MKTEQIKEILEKQLEEISKLSDEERAYWKEEERKCLESPLYFYNNFWRKKGDPELTQEEFDIQVYKADLERVRARNRQRFNFTTDMLDFKLTNSLLSVPFPNHPDKHLKNNPD
jgi:hypothetical protein